MDESHLSRVVLNQDLSHLNATVKAKLSDHKYFGRLIDLIEVHPHRDDLCSLHAALIVRGGNILSIGYNTPKRNVFVDMHALHCKFTTHAECRSVLKARRKIDLKGTTLYVARLRKKDGVVANSKPCESCQEIIKKYGIKKVVYTTFEGFEVMKRSQMS